MTWFQYNPDTKYFYNYPKLKPYYRKSGGLGFFVRQHLANYVDSAEPKSEYTAWIKISMKALKLGKDILIVAVYIPPKQSRFFNDDDFDLFEQEISSACSKDCYLLLIGDFNAPICDMQEFTSSDSFLSEYFDFVENTVQFMNQKCVFEKHNVQINRTSEDNKVNNSGQRLVDICKMCNLFILNGH